MNFRKIARLHAGIWWSHDAENYSGIEHDAREMLGELDLHEKKFAGVPKLVRNVYFNYDAATNARNREKRELFFGKMHSCDMKIMRALGAGRLSASLYTSWVKAFYHRFFAASLFFLFLYHLARFPIRVWPFVLKPFYFLARAGLKGHNKRDRKKAERYLEKYWVEIERTSEKARLPVSLFVF